MRQSWLVLASSALISGCGNHQGSNLDSSVADDASAGDPNDGTVAPTDGHNEGVAHFVWITADATGFDPRACDDPTNVTNFDLDFYNATQQLRDFVASFGMSSVSAYDWDAAQCQYSGSTFMSFQYLFEGTPAQIDAVGAAPPPTFHGTYVDLTFAVQTVKHLEHHYYLSGDAVPPPALDDVFVHDVTAMATEKDFIANVCQAHNPNGAAMFYAMMAMSPIQTQALNYLAALGSPDYHFGANAEMSFAHTGTFTLKRAIEAFMCPNWQDP